MAENPEDNQENLSEEEKLRQSINDLIEELNESLKEQGVSDDIREVKIKAYKDFIDTIGGSTERLKEFQNSLNGEIEATVLSSKNYGGEIESIVSRLNEVVESITNQSDLSNRILGSFKKIRSVSNSIADDADLSYVRSAKYMDNQKDILNVQEKRLEAQALEGAQALEALNVSNDLAKNGNTLINLRQQKAVIEQEALDLRMEGKIAEAESREEVIKQYKEQIKSKQVEQQKMSIVNTSLDKAKKGTELSEQEVESLKEYTRVNDNLSEQDRQRIIAAIEFNSELVDGRTHFQNLQKAIDDSIAREEELNRRMGLTGAIMDSFSKIPGFSAIFKSEDIEHVKNLAREAYVEQQRFAKQAKADKEAILEVEKQIRDLESDPVGNADQIEILKVTKRRLIESKKNNEEAATNVQLTTRTQIMGTLLNKTLGNLKNALTDPATIFTFLVTKGLQFNSEVTDISKNLGVTETQATKIRNEFTSISANTMDTAINTERLLKSQSELNKELSLGVMFSDATLVNFTRLTEKIGLSAQQAAKLTLASASTGESATEFAGKSALAAAQQAKTLGITINMKEIMEDTANLTNEQLILFGRQPEAIGKTLAEVKKLGIELGDLNAISSKLLDFQGSIESELEAELLTGKQLNLERARAAALAGDQATLAREIASQVGTISEFESMNVLQRQKLAESLGMNVNQLSGVLIRQEAINKGIADAKDLTDEQLAAAQKLKDTGQAETLAEAVVQIQEQRSAQDKFNDAVIKLQRLFGELLGGPVGELLDALVDVASVVIGPVASALNFILTPVKALTTLLTKVPNILKVIAAGLIALNFGGISASVGGIVTKIGDIGKGIGGLVSKAGDLGKNLVSSLSSGGEGVKGVFDKIKSGFTGVQDQAAGIEFDPRMAGGGRFRNMTTGRLVSEETANAAGVFKPGTELIPSPVPNLAEGTDDIAGIPAVADDGSMLKEKMKNIAEGLKSFASMEVVKGALALTIASPGLFILSKAADGLNKLGEVKGEALQEAMKGIAEGVEKFGTVRVVLGSIGLILASPGLVLLSMSVGGLKNLAGIGAETTKEAMSGLAEGIGEFGSVSVIAGAIGLTIASPGLVLLGISTKGLKSLSEIDTDTTKEAMNSIAEGVGKFASITIVGGAIGLTLAAPGLLLLGASSLGLKALDSIKPKKIKEAMKSIAKGVGEFATTEVAMGAIGVLLASPGLILLGASSIGLRVLESIKPKKLKAAMESIAKGISKFASPKAVLGGLALIPVSLALATMAVGAIGLGAIALLGAPAAAGMAALTAGLTTLGTAAATGVPFLGVALIGAFGLALIPFGAALGLAAPAIEAIGTVIASTIMSIANAIVTVIPALTQGLIDLSNNVSISGLIGLGAALPVLALGLTVFGAALIPIGLASISLLIVSKALSPIAEMAPKLDLANTAIKGMATSIALLATSLNTIDASALETLSNFEGNITLSTVNTTDQTNNTTDNTLSNLEQLTITANTVTLTGETISTVAATNTSEQVSAVTNTANTLDQTVATTNSLANLITKQNTTTTTTVEPITPEVAPVTTEIVPGISVTTPPPTTTQETLTTNTENLSTATSNAAINLEKLTTVTTNILPTTTSSTQLAPGTAMAEVTPVNLEPPTEIVPGISVATPEPETVNTPALKRILTLTTEQINTAIGVLTTTTPTLDTLKAQAGLVDLRDGQQDIPTEKFSNKSLEIIDAVINTVTKLGTDTEFQQIGEKIAGAEISVTEGQGIEEERVKLFRAKEPELGTSIEATPTPFNEGEKTDTSQVFIDNLQPLIAETVTATVNALVPPMVAALKEGQGKVKVVNDNFNASGQKGDINTIRRLPSDNFA